MREKGTLMVSNSKYNFRTSTPHHRLPLPSLLSLMASTEECVAKLSRKKIMDHKVTHSSLLFFLLILTAIHIFFTLNKSICGLIFFFFPRQHTKPMHQRMVFCRFYCRDSRRVGSRHLACQLMKGLASGHFHHRSCPNLMLCQPCLIMPSSHSSPSLSHTASYSITYFTTT